MGTITTSSLELSAGPSAQIYVSLRGPVSQAHLHRWEVWVLAGPFQEVGRPGADRTSPCRRVNRGCFGKEKVGSGAVVKGKLTSMRWICLHMSSFSFIR